MIASAQHLVAKVPKTWRQFAFGADISIWKVRIAAVPGTSRSAGTLVAEQGRLATTGQSCPELPNGTHRSTVNGGAANEAS